MQSNLRKKKILSILTILFSLSVGYSQLANFWNTEASGTISGRVFQDFNGNGTYDTTTTITNNGAGTIGVAIDRGVQNVTVTVYDSAGVSRGTTTTAATTGIYSISATGTGPYRVEFTNVPTGYFPSARSTDSVLGGTATNSGSSVQFVNDGNTSNVNLAINYPADYSQNNPEILASMYVSGDQIAGVNNGLPVLVSFPYSSGSNDTATGATESLFDLPSANPLELAANEVGTTFGLAYARKSRLIYSGAFFKRHAGFGPGGPNRIYVVDRAGNGSVSTAFTVPGTATNAHNPADYPHDNGNTGWDAVGKTSLGGIALSEDESTLYAMNLADRTLYELNPGTGAQIRSLATLPTMPVNVGNCADTDRRPFAVNQYRGTLYVGFICSAESTANVDTFTDSNGDGDHDGGDYFIDLDGDEVRDAGESYIDLNGNGSFDNGENFVDNDGNGFYNRGDARKLYAYVFSVNLTTFTYNAAPAFSMPLNYRRGINTHTQGAFGVWRPWSNIYRSGSTTNPLRPNYAQPMLTDIAFDNGNIVLGLRDRIGDQVGNGALSNPNDPSMTNLYQPRTSGDALRACGSIGAWTAENNGRCGGTGTSPQNVSEGPGGGEFYYGDAYDLQDNYVSPAVTINGKGGNHDDTLNGGVEQMPGSPDMIMTNFDPIPNIANMIHDGGIRWLNNTTGNFTKGYRLFDGAGSDTTIMGKAGGIGGSIVILPDPAPIEIGNRVWRDTDNDGVQDPGENGIAAVTVRLYNSGNTLVGTAVTDANGEYYFVGSTVVDPNITDNIGQINGGISYNANYQVRFDLAANYTGAGPLTGLLLTTRDQTTQAGFDDGSDSDANVVLNPTGSPAGGFPVITVATGNPGENNHTLDTGFASSATFSLGNRVWFDTDNDGQIDAAEVGISGVQVSYFADANTDGVPDGAALGTMNTDANGYYRFDGLASGNYVVRVNSGNFANGAVLGGYLNTSGSNSTDLDSTSVAGQNGENGIIPAGAANAVQTSGILSATIFLGAPGEPLSEADVHASGQGAIDPAANMTVDFGFFRACLSGTVWSDNGAGANNNNGILNVGELPIQFVRVQLYNSSNVEMLVGTDGILGTSDDGVNGMLTNGSGNYSFCNLPPGQVRVVVTPSGGTTSTPTSLTPDDNIDSDDNGFNGTSPFVGKVTSGLVTILPGSTGALNNKTVTNSNALTSDPTVDFGFVLPPTAIRLESFTAFTDGNTVSLKWSTGGESGNLGFNIYRETNGKRELLNAAPVAGSGLRSSVELVASGENYGWIDADTKRSALYYLEDIAMDGTTTLHGPISPTFKVFVNKFERQSALLSDLTRVESPSAQKESVGESESENSSFNQSLQWQIAAQNGVKITVNHDGWYRVSTAQLQSAGFDVNSNRNNWQLYANTEQIPLLVGADGSIEFFGRGMDTPQTDKQVYYLIKGQSAGLRVIDVKGGVTEEAPAQSYPVTVQRKDRSIYVSSILNGDAENWFGAIINRTAQTVQNLTLNKIAAQNSAHVSVRLQGLTAGTHVVNVKFNNFDLGAVSFSDMQNRQFEFDVPASSLIEGTNSIQFQSVGAGNDVSLVDTVSVMYSRRYEAVNNKIRFSVPAGETANVSRFSTGKIIIYEIQNGRATRQVTVQMDRDDLGEYFFGLEPATYDREFIALASSQTEQAVLVEQNFASNWNSPANQAVFVIIAPTVLQNQAANLATIRQNQGLQTRVVLTEDIADEFGSGVLTSDAIRQFLQNAVTNWAVKPKYVLLFGDSSFDVRNYLGQENRNLIPTRLVDTGFMETSNDGWLADFNHDGIENIALGRLPAANETEANILIAKLIRYDNQNRVGRSEVIVTDSGFESYSNALQAEVPNNVPTVRIDRSTMTDVQMHGSILSNLNNNPMVVTYIGHGSTGVWSSTAIFSNADAVNLNNPQLSFYMLMTCLNGFTHNMGGDSLAEASLKAENGGAVAVWASSGMPFANPQFEITQTMTRLIFSNGSNPTRIGDIIRQAKQSTADPDVRRMSQLFGDPTLFVK